MRLWGAFEAEPKCLTLPSEAHKKRRGRPASCREEGKAAVRLWGAFEAEPKCLTLPSEAHKKRGGRLRTGHREAARGLPAAERLLKPVQNASRCLRKPIRREEAGFGQATERSQEAEKLLKAVQNA